MSQRLPLLQAAPKAAEAPSDWLPQTTVAADQPVLAGHDHPVFGDGVWDLSAGMHRKNSRRSNQIDWVAFSADCGPLWTQVAKEYIWHRLNRKVARVWPAKVETAHIEVGRLRRLAKHLLDNEKVASPSAITREVAARLLVWIKEERDAESAQHYIRQAQRLYLFRDVLCDSPGDALWRDRPAQQLAPADLSQRGNKTPKIPPEVMRPLLDGCVYILEHEVDSRLGPWERGQVADRSEAPPPENDLSPEGRIRRWLSRRAELGRGAPRQRGNFNVAQAKREAAVGKKVFKKDEVRGLIDEHVNGFGWDDDGDELSAPDYAVQYKGSALQRLQRWGAERLDPLPIVRSRSATRACPFPMDDQLRSVALKAICREADVLPGCFYSKGPTATALWMELRHIGARVGVNGRAGRRFADLTGDRPSLTPLMSAAYVLIAYLTGMRESEVTATRAGCIKVRRSDDGLIERYWIESRAFKGEEARGRVRRWVAIEPVQRAVRVLERRLVALGLGDDRVGLFEGISDSRVAPPFSPKHLNDLRDYINELAGKGLGAPIPEVRVGGRGEAKAWDLSTRQFRRTLAWFIARQPMGVIAGSIQYGHMKSATYDNYAGETYDGLHEEIAQEEILASEDTLFELYQEYHAGNPPLGPKRRQLEAVFDGVDAKVAIEFPGKALSSTELKRLLKARLGLLRQGLYNLCSFDPAKAGCLESAPPDYDRDAPIMAFCNPLRCENSCIAPWQRPAYEANLRETEEMMGLKAISPLQRKHLQQYADRLRRVLNGQEAA